MTVLEYLDRFPPCLVRFLARTGQGFGQRRLTLKEISERSGLAIGTVINLSMRITWQGMTLRTIDAYTQACEIDLFDMSYEFRRLKALEQNRFYFLRHPVRKCNKARILRHYAQVAQRIKDANLGERHRSARRQVFQPFASRVSKASGQGCVDSAGVASL